MMFFAVLSGVNLPATQSGVCPHPSPTALPDASRLARHSRTRATREGLLLLAVLCWGILELNVRTIAAAEVFPKPGEWPCDRRNPSLDARSPLRGRITQPRVVWKQFVGTLESLIVVAPDGRNSQLALPIDEMPGLPTDERLALAPFLPAPETDESGHRSPTVVFADVLPDEPGLEKIEFESAFSKPTVKGQWQKCVGRCFVRRDGQWVQVWQTEPLDHLFQPLPLVGDFDGDGAVEVAILPFYELLLLDGRTGRVKDRCRFTDTRSYGFFGVYDFDGDGKSEFLVQADFSKHLDVLGFRDGKLRVFWQRNIEPDISNPQKILRVGPAPVADVDGDGRAEVFACVFNDASDQRWHITVHDALTGRVTSDFVDEYLAAPLDVDGDGVSELLTVSAQGAGVPEFGTIRVYSLKHGDSRLLWQQRNSAWQMWEPPLPANVQSTATFGGRTILGRKRGAQPLLAIRQTVEAHGPGRNHGPVPVRLNLVRWTPRGFEPLTSIKGENLDALGLDDSGRFLVRSRHPPRQQSALVIKHGRGQILSTARVGGSAGPVTMAWPDRAAGPTIVVQGVGKELVAFPPPSRDQVEASSVRHLSIASGQAPQDDSVALSGATKRIVGRGQSTTWPETRGPVIADLLGDGRRQIVLATSAPSGCARLAAQTLNGRELWHHDFPDIPGEPPIWNTGGILLWQAGQFTERGRRDVLVTIRRSMMHSEETLLLSGRDGRELWRRARQISQRGVGGAPFAVADFDEDDLDDATSLNPSILYALKGTSGRDILAQDASWPEVPARPVYWGVPFAGDFLGSGRTAIFFGGRSMTGVVRVDGSLVWWDALDNAAQGPHAFGDFNGDGRLEAIALGYADGARCYDTATGKVLWRLPLDSPGGASGSASVDLDSDGRDEALFVFGNSLVCVGTALDGKHGEVRWRLELPGRVGPPSIMALDGDGSLTISVAGADGFVYGIQ